MTPLTTCQAIQYALIPGISEDFERIASAQKYLGKDSLLSYCRTYLCGGLAGIAVGVIGMGETDCYQKCVTLTMASTLVTAIGSSMLYDATKRIQHIWNSKLSTQNHPDATFKKASGQATLL